jgi:hypothetical protein
MLSGDCRRKGNCKVCMARFRVQFLLADEEFPLNISLQKYPAKTWETLCNPQIKFPN